MLIMPPAVIPKVTLKCYNPGVTFGPVTMETGPYSMNKWYLKKKMIERKEKRKPAGRKARGNGGGNKV